MNPVYNKNYVSGRLGLATQQPGFVHFSIFWDFNFSASMTFKVLKEGSSFFV
jgi:hypothetical protein